MGNEPNKIVLKHNNNFSHLSKISSKHLFNYSKT